MNVVDILASDWFIHRRLSQIFKQANPKINVNQSFQTNQSINGKPEN